MLFFKIIKLIYRCKLKFKNPTKTDILVLDDTGAERLEFLIKNYDHFILPIRYNKISNIYISFKIINNLIKYFNKTNLSKAYFCSLIEIINPKLIITNIDNSLPISNIAKILENKFNFLAIQNAARYEFHEYGKKHASKFFIPELACFGNFEKSLYKKYNIKVKKFFVCGSINILNYQNFIKLNKEKISKKRFDICLISEPSPGWDKKFPGFEKALGKIADFTVRFAKKHNMKLVFAGKRPKFTYVNSSKKINKNFIEEVNFYKKHIAGNFKILERNIDNYSSYQAMHNSRISIGMVSSLLRENFALSGKSLSCNFTNDKTWDFPIKGICSLNDLDFKKFEKRVLKILSMSYKNYILNFKQKPNYLMYINKNKTTQDLLKKKIKSFLI